MIPTYLSDTYQYTTSIMYILLLTIVRKLTGDSWLGANHVKSKLVIYSNKLINTSTLGYIYNITKN